MKSLINFSRWIVGLLFIFSGLIKANDPHGLSYKMQEFFERWAADGLLPGLMNWLHRFSLEFSILMIALEIVAGVAILLGLWKNFFTWLLFILIIFFTALTGYADLSGKITECGCFGDCIPLTSKQSFIKDIILFVLILILLIGRKHIKPAFPKFVNIFIFEIVVIFSFYSQWYVMRKLPVLDCLPFKIGNNILDLRKMPADAVPDKKDYIFVYEKDGLKKEFNIKDLPDSSWTFVSRKDVIIQKGHNNEPPIKDYLLITKDGADTTDAVLSLDSDYYMFYVNHVKSSSSKWFDDFRKVQQFASQSKIPLVIVTSDPEDSHSFFSMEKQLHLPILALDAVAFKTAARTNPELYLMHGPVVKNKWGSADILSALRK